MLGAEIVEPAQLLRWKDRDGYERAVSDRGQEEKEPIEGQTVEELRAQVMEGPANSLQFLVKLRTTETVVVSGV